MEEGTEKPLKVLRTSLRGRKRRLDPEELDSESDGIQRVVYVPDSGGKSLVVRRKSPVKREAGIDGRRGKGPIFGRKRSSDEDYEKPKRGRGRPPKKLRRGLRVQGKSVVLKPEKMYIRRGVREIRKNSVSSPNVSSGDVSERPKSREKSAKKQFLEKNRTREPEVEPVKAEVSPPVKGRENGRMTEKQNLRERMKEMLLSLGWEIDMRPRNGKDYEDQVYISPPPKRRGHWSILNAYYALLEEHGCTIQDVEEQVLNGKVLPFTIIHREELALLKRNQVKKRVSKKWQEQPEKKGKDGRGRKRKAKYEENRKDTKRRKVKEDYEDDSFVSSRKETSRAGKAKRVSGDKGRVFQGRRCRLLVRGSNQNEDAVSDDYVLFDGKRTVLSWMIDLGVILENGKVKYMNRRRTRAVHEGSITRDGINCMCCSKIVTVSKFEVHAGSKLCQPYENIFVDGVEHSLLQCQQDAWNKQEESERCGFYTIDTGGDDPNDDTCIICGDGGDLICCDSCPSTFHQSCLGIKVLPSGDWHCPNCSCRFCGEADSSSNHGNSLTNLPLRSCGQCQEKFHQKCISEANGVSRSSTSPFCGKHCRKLFGKVQKLLGVQHPLEAGFSWILIKRFDEDSKVSLPGHALRAECNSKLAVALTVMDECFLPIIDQRSGINLIHNVLYNCGSNFNRLDYSGFYTMVLEREDEIISVATIRIHGTRLAEMPFIGTRIMYRRQGMCRRLMNAIETVLRSLNVEKLVIPAISELFDTWTMLFGFKPLEETHKQEMKSISMLVFPFTDMLHKPLLKKDLDEESPMPIADGKNTEVKSSTKPEMANNSNVLPPSGHDSHSLDKMCELHQPTVKIVDDGAISDDQKVNDHSGMETKSYTGSVDSHLQTLHGGILNHSHEVKIETDGIQPINESGDADVFGGKSVHGKAEHPDGVPEANPDEATHLNSSELQTAGPVPDSQSSKESFHAVTVDAADTKPEYRAPEEASGNHTSGAISDSSILVASDSLFASHIELEAKVVEDSRHTAIEDSSFQVDDGEKDEVFSHSSVVVANLSHTACLEFEIRDGMNAGHYASKTSSEKFDDTSVENKALSDCYVAVGNEFRTVCLNEVNVTMGEDSVHHPDGVLEANPDEATRLNSSELLTAGPVPDGQSSEESFHTATEDSSFQVDNGEKDEVFSHFSVVVANLSHTACPEFEIRDGMNSGHYASKTSSEKFDDTSVENKALSHCYVAVGNEFCTVCPNDVNVTMGEDSVHHPDGVLETNPDEASHLNSSELLTAGPVPDGQSSEEGFHAVTVDAADTKPEYRASEEASGNHTSGVISDSSILVASESLPASHNELEAAVVEDSGHTAMGDSSFQVDNGINDEVFSHSSVLVANLSHTACPEFETSDGMNSGHYASKTSSEKFDDTSVENKAPSHSYVAVGYEFCTVCPNEVNVTMGEDPVHHELINTLRVNNEVAFAEDGSSSGGSGDNTMVPAMCSRSSVNIESSAAVSVELDTYAGNECMVDGMHENKAIAAVATAVAATEQAVDTAMVHVPSSDTASGEKAQVSSGNFSFLDPQTEIQISSTVCEHDVPDSDGSVAHDDSKLLDETKHTNSTSEMHINDKHTLTNGCLESLVQKVSTCLSGEGTELDHRETNNQGIGLEHNSCTLTVRHVQNHVESKSIVADADLHIDKGEVLHGAQLEIEATMVNHIDSTRLCDDGARDLNGLKDKAVSMESDVCASVGDKRLSYR